MSKPKVYLETSFIGYLTGRLSRDLITAAHQQLTRSWWEGQRHKFALHISDFVLREVSGGDPAAAQERLGVLTGVAELETPSRAPSVARALIDKRLVPAKSAVDALHVAVAAVSGMDYLLTWNCKHIANATTREGIAAALRHLGYKPVVLCTPEELIGVDDDNG